MGEWLKGPEILILLVLLVLLFGAKRLPDTARGLGRSLRIFKAETKGLREDGDDTDTPAAPTQQVVRQQPEIAPAQPSADQQMAAMQQQMAALRQQVQGQGQVQQQPAAPAPAPAPQADREPSDR